MSKMINCRACGKEIASSAKACPGCGAKNKKPLYKRPWFLILAFLFVVGAMGDSDDNSYTEENISSNNESYSYSENISSNNESYLYSNDENEKVEQPSVDEDIPTEYKSALKKAQSYNDMMHMSKAGLYKQLTSEYGEKFSEESAQYAIDNVNANWKENALKKAQSYQDMMSMSPSAIYDQLVSEYGEQFTEEEAQYAIDNLK